MTNINLKQCMKLYNAGKLTELSDNWFMKRGYFVVRMGGKVYDIIKLETVTI